MVPVLFGGLAVLLPVDLAELKHVHLQRRLNAGGLQHRRVSHVVGIHPLMVFVVLGEFAVLLRVELLEQKHVQIQYHRSAGALQRQQLSHVLAILVLVVKHVNQGHVAHQSMVPVIFGELVALLVEAGHKHVQIQHHLNAEGLQL